MSVRVADAAIPANEDLYRSVAPADVLDGARVLPSAVDLPASSCNRAAYGAPSSVLLPGRPLDTGVVAVRVGDLPPPVAGGDPARPTAYAFVAADDPQEDNPAHAEVRVGRVGQPYDPHHKPASKPLKLRLRVALADRMRVVIPPPAGGAAGGPRGR